MEDSQGFWKAVSIVQGLGDGEHPGVHSHEGGTRKVIGSCHGLKEEVTFHVTNGTSTMYWASMGKYFTQDLLNPQHTLSSVTRGKGKHGDTV